VENSKKHIVLKGNEKLEKKLDKFLERKEKIKKSVQSGASIEEIRK